MLITKETIELILKKDDVLVPKRCTEKYMRKYGIYDALMLRTSHLDPAPLIERIQYILQDKEGIPSCKGCGKRVKLVDARFQVFCSIKCSSNHPDVRERTRNTNLEKNGYDPCEKKAIDYTLLYDLYITQEKSIFEISKILGNISNVSVQARLKEHGIPQRNRSDTQTLAMAPFKGKFRPDIKIDREELVRLYSIEKTPIRALAEKYECHEETIRRFLEQENVERTHRRSYIEHKIVNFLKAENITYKGNDRALLWPLFEIDFLLAEYNIGIETHGLVTHSWIRGEKEPEYHFEKYQAAKDKGIRLFQFWEPDVIEKLPIISSMILNACGKSKTKLGARKCKVIEIPYSVFAKFCNENHIQGAPGKNNKCVALEYEGQVVSVLCYLQKEDTTMITRFCSLLNHNVMGAFSKLLKIIPGSTIVTYSSNDISVGDIYKSNGFVETANQKTDMWYCDLNKIYNRQKFMKKNITHFPEYDESKSEIQIMIDSGYDVIYKSGTRTWTLQR